MGANQQHGRTLKRKKGNSNKSSGSNKSKGSSSSYKSTNGPTAAPVESTPPPAVADDLFVPKITVLHKSYGELFSDDSMPLELSSSISAPGSLNDLKSYLLDLGVVQGNEDRNTSALVEASISSVISLELDTVGEPCINLDGGGVIMMELRAFPNCSSALDCGADSDAVEGVDFQRLSPYRVPLSVSTFAINKDAAELQSISFTASVNQASFVLEDEEPGNFFLQALLILNTGLFGELSTAGSCTPETRVRTRRALLDAQYGVAVYNWVISITENVVVTESPDPADGPDNFDRNRHA